MKAVAEPVLRVRVAAQPRPDPLPVRTLQAWTMHGPWVLALAAFAAAAFFLTPRELGFFATGAGWAVVLVAASRAWLRATCQAVHLAGGVITLCILRGPIEAGGFALAAGTVFVATVGARAWALQVRPELAPLAGRLPWRFRASFRRVALKFGVAGLALGVPLALFAPTPVLRVVGVAMLPLALRSYIGALLSIRATRAIWCLAVSLHLAVLGFFVPAYGAIAAAWAVVATETVLFAGGALIAARRTGVAPLPLLHFAAFLGAALIVVLLTIPSPDYTVLIGVALGVAAGAFFWRHKHA